MNRKIQLMVFFSLLFLAISTDLPAAQRKTPDASPPAWTLQNRPATAPLIFSAFEKVHADLQQTGYVRVIVRLRDTTETPLSFMAEGKLPDSQAIDKQRKTIKKNQGALEERLSTKGKAKTKKFSNIPFMALEVDATDFQTLLNSPEVDLIEEDIPVPPTLAESIPLIGGDGSGAFSGYTGTGQTVAILDTGVATSHPVFSGKIVSEACYSTTVSGQSTSVCPNGQNSQTGSGAGINCNTSIAGCDHGTHVASIAAGSSGVAKNANIIAIQVFANFNNTALSWSSDQILALERVYALRTSFAISSVNMSLGGGGPYATNCDASNAAFKAAVDNLRSVNIATIIATGNNSFTTGISSPGCVSTAISVGSTTKQNAVASYSNSSSLVKLLAPGSSIFAAIPGNSYAYKSGTSMATPHVTGAWAVMKSRNPGATVDAVLTELTNRGVSTTDSRNGVTKPRIKLDTAVAQIPVDPRIQFTSAGYSVNENARTATITVRRDISSTGAVSVDWATSNGTAIAGDDYTAANGTISFADGESGDKTFTVSITDDVLSEPAETFNLSLSNPTGGAVLGAQSTAVLTINIDIDDLINDGKPDIYWFNPLTGKSGVWYMSGETRISVGLFPDAPIGWNIIKVLDYNKDGKKDIIWHNPSTGQSGAWYMNGAIRISVGLFPNAPVGWKIVDVIDYDKDGNYDLIWFKPSTGEAAVWYMNGINRTRYDFFPTAALGWNLIGIKDYNGDGNLDLIWLKPSTGQSGVWYMNGATRNSLGLFPNAPVGWNIVDVIDYDKDGNYDLVWFKSSTGEAAVWYMNGINRTRYDFFPTAALGWDLIGVKDYNGDGNLDLIWLKPSTGQSGAWYMNGASRNSLGLFPNAPIGWNIAGVTD